MSKKGKDALGSPAPSVAHSTAAISSGSSSSPWSVLHSVSCTSWSSLHDDASAIIQPDATVSHDIGNMGDFSDDDATDNANNPWEVIDSILGPLDFHNLAAGPHQPAAGPHDADQPAAGPHDADQPAEADEPADGPHDADQPAEADEPADGPHAADQPAADVQPAYQMPTTIDPDQDVAEPPHRPLSSAQIGAIADALRRANMTGSISIQDYGNACGAPTAEHIWGPHISWAMIYFAARYVQRAKLNNAWYLWNADGLRWGWWYAPREFNKNNALTPVNLSEDTLFYPCVFLKIGNDYYMICIHLLIKLARMWLTHPSRFVAWSW